MGAVLAIFSGPYAMVAKWGVIALLVLACMAFAAVKMHQHDQISYDKLETEYVTFKTNTEKLGRQAQQAADVQKANDIANKRKADADHDKTVAALNLTIAGLRSANPSRSVLPAPPAGSSRPDLACFDRAEYLREDGNAAAKLFAGARSLADEGTAATIDLDTAKLWAGGGQVAR